MKVQQIALCLSIIAFLACGCTEVEITPESKHEIVAYDKKTISITGPLNLCINADSSNIEVYSQKKQEAILEITKRIRGTKTQEELKKEMDYYNISIEESGNSIVIDSKFRGKIKNPTHYSADFKIYIPKEVDSICLKLDTGKVTFYDDINCVLLADIDTANVTINRFDGRIEASFCKGDMRIASGKLERSSCIKTDIGNISVKSEVDDNGEYTFQTGIGNIELFFNKESNIMVESIGNLETNEFLQSSSGPMVKAYSNFGKINIRKY
ncbi:MAG: hypothetical protein ACOX7R_10410 [Acetivibrionales bacterium]